MQENQYIVEELMNASEQGIMVRVCGVSYAGKSKEEISKVLQKGSYMLDYEGDEEGHIVAVNVDPVGPVEKPFYKSLRCTKK